MRQGKRTYFSVTIRRAACAAIPVLLCACAHAAGLKYQAPVIVPTGTAAPFRFAVGDFNGDGKPDLAVADNAGTTISVYLNQNAGTFAAPVVTTLTVDDTLGAILSGDFNGDGKADLVVSTVAGIDQAAIVLLSNGDGSFVVQPPITGSFGFLSGKVADFNGDGHLDLLLGGDGSTYLFLGQGNGTFAPASVGTGSFPGVYSGSSVGDFNGDKHLDAIVTDYGNPGNELGAINFFPGDGSGNLGNAVTYQPGLIQNPFSVDVADFNGDGKTDLLVSGNSAVFVIFGNGDGTFQTGNSQVVIIDAEDNQNTSPPDELTAVTVDLNGDGIPDVAGLDGTTGLLSLLVNDGTGTFPNALNTPYTFSLTPDSYAMATADFNGDGLPDVVIASLNAKTLTILLSMKVPVTPSVALTSSGNSLLAATSLVFKAVVSGGASTPTGSVSLLDGSSPIAQQSLDASGTAMFNVSSLSAGVHSLSLTYAGDANYAAATSATLSQSVTDFQVAATPASVTVPAGSTANYTVTVNPIAGFTGAVALTCTGLPTLATCNSPSITVGSGAATATLAISTTAVSSADARLPGAATYACLLLGCFSLCQLVRRKTRGGRFGCLMAVFLLAGIVGVGGCGGGGSKPTQPGTPSGTSTITITATVTQNGVTATHSSTATLVVQ